MSDKIQGSDSSASSSADTRVDNKGGQLVPYRPQEQTLPAPIPVQIKGVAYPELDDGDPFAVELPGSQNYGICLYMCAQALANEEYHDALLLARQAEMVGALTDAKTRLPRVTNAYVRIIIACTLELRAQAMSDADLAHVNLDLLDTSVNACKNLLNRLLQHGKEVPVMLGKTILTKLSEARTVAGEKRKVTTAESLDAYLTALKLSIEMASRLDITGGEANLSIKSRVVIARKALEAAANCLKYWFAKSRSDWKKAQVLCRFSADILSPKPNVMETPVAEMASKFQVADGLLIPSTGTEVTTTIALVGKLSEAFGSRDYNQSLALLKATNSALNAI